MTTRQLALAGLIALHAPRALAAAPTAPADGLLIPFAVDGTPAEWVRRAVPRTLPPLERLRRLSRVLLGADGRGIDDRVAETPTAALAFATRRANCVGYANLFVGLARELGVPAYFVLVDDLGIPPGGAQERGLAVAEGHLAAAWSRGASTVVFDLAGESDGRHLRLRPITDLAAIAVFYSNRGVEALLAGRDDDATSWLGTAVQLEPTSLPAAWVNFGVALRRQGDLDGALRAYRRALELDPTAPEARRNLGTLLALRGDPGAAEALLAGRDELEDLDSLGALELARRRLLAGDLLAARGLYTRALQLSRPER